MSFINIKGQDKALAIIRGYLEHNRLQGGYLFAGPQGVGKKAVAIALAKALNCANKDFAACDDCPSCKKISNNQHPDVHIIENSDSEIKIESVRQLQREVNLKPYEAARGVVIIDNAHRFTPEASGAILKILEEPPKNVLFILISDKLPLLFKTIISRCKIVRFNAMPRLELKRFLEEEYKLMSDFAHFLAFFCEGRLGAALSLKQTDIFKKKNMVIDRFVLSQRASPDLLVLQNKSDTREYLNILATWFRDIYLMKIGMPHIEIINFDRKEELLNCLNRFSFIDLDEILKSISESILLLEQNVNLRLLMHHLGAQIWRN